MIAGRMIGKTIDIDKVAGIGEYSEREWKDGDDINRVYAVVEGGKAFLVVRPKTIEVRCEKNLGRKLRDEYESVMESRYFGRGGIELVMCGQLDDSEIEDLVRLSYNLTVGELEDDARKSSED